jgi:hypothetical protein
LRKLKEAFVFIAFVAGVCWNKYIKALFVGVVALISERA